MGSAKECQELDQLQIPLIIAMKDDPIGSSHSRIIGQKLASFLKYPFIDQKDVTQTILNTAKTEITNQLAHKLGFEVVCLIASTQLDSKINLIINSPLSDNVHLDRLAQVVASSEEGRMIIIESNNTTKKTKDGYDAAGKIGKLKIDAETFDAKKAVSEISSTLYRMEKGKSVAESAKSRALPRNDHLHELVLSEKPRKDNLVCKICSNVLSDS